MVANICKWCNWQGLGCNLQNITTVHITHQQHQKTTAQLKNGQKTIIDISPEKTDRWPVQFSSVSRSGPALCNPMDCSTPGFLVHHQLLELAQTHIHWVGDAIQPPHPLSSPFPPAFNLSQNQGLIQWASSLHQVAQILEFQLQHQSFQWVFRANFL